MNSTELLADVKRKAQIEDGQDTLSDTDLLDLATKELQTVITPKILSVRENFMATYKDFTLTTARTYRIPFEATGNKVLAVELVESGSNQRRRLIQIGMMENPAREGFYFRSGSIVLSALVPDNGTLRIHYCARPGRLVSTAGTDVFVIENFPDDFTIQLSQAHGLDTQAVVSMQKKTSPFEFCKQNVIVTGTPSTTQLEFADSIADIGLEIGDFVTVTNEEFDEPGAEQESASYFPQIPIELHDWLSYRTACRVLEHLGHEDLLMQKVAKLGDMEKDLLALISPRANDEGKMIFEKELLGDVWI